MPSPSRSWRDIPQEVKTRAMTSTGKKRAAISWVKLVLGTLFVVAAVLGAVVLVDTMENNPRQISQPVVDKLELSTDGVLKRDWVLRTLAVSRSATLLELDLQALQAKLMDNGQIRTAVLVKRFPSTLVVTLTERAPVARIMAEDAGVRRELLVARDGVVFSGEGFERASLEVLPWLDGVRLVRSRGRLAPITGMELVSDLLSRARYESEHLYPLFRYVSLARLESDGEIEVRSPECDGIVFSTREDFFRQLAWLDYIRDTMAPTSEVPLARLDLTNAGNRMVPVKPYAPQIPARDSVDAQQPSRSQSVRYAASSSHLPSIQPAESAPSVAKPLRQPPTRPAATSASPALSNPQRNSPHREL